MFLATQIALLGALRPPWAALEIGQPLFRGPEQFLLLLTTGTPVGSIEGGPSVRAR